MKKAIRNKQHGFGLVEVLVSITLIVMVVIAFNQLSLFAFRNWESAKNKSVAYNLIQSTIEDLHNKRDKNVNSPDSVWLGIESASAAQITTINNKDYATVIAVSPVTVNLPGWPNLTESKKKVVVTVSWAERAGDKSLTGITYLTDWKSKY